ncbi:hypothetical protein BGX28_009292, partial [Mortierella sp. GBA30]
FQATTIFATVLVILSFSSVNAIPVEGHLPVAVAADEPLLTRGDGKFVIPSDANIEDSKVDNGDVKKPTGCGFRSFFTYHSCL